MTDRDWDNSQHPTDQTNTHDDSFYGNTTMDDVEIQKPEGQYATAADMVDYIDPAVFADYLRENAGKFFVRSTGTEKRTHSRQVIVSQVLDSGPGTINGFSFKELTGTATASFSLHDGIDASAGTILEVNLAANESVRDYFPNGGISYRYGLYVSIDTGSARGNIFQQVVTNV